MARWSQHVSRTRIAARPARAYRFEPDFARGRTTRVAANCPCAWSRNEQFARANQVARRKFGNFGATRPDAVRLEAGRAERIEIHRFARGFLKPIHASLHTAGQLAAAANG